VQPVTGRGKVPVEGGRDVRRAAGGASAAATLLDECIARQHEAFKLGGEGVIAPGKVGRAGDGRRQCGGKPGDPRALSLLWGGDISAESGGGSV